MISNATLFVCLALVLGQSLVHGGEYCLRKPQKFCLFYCCRPNIPGLYADEFCCSRCKESVRNDRCPTMTTTTRPPIRRSWWSTHGWWVSTGIRIVIPTCFFLIGGIIIGILVCTGKIKLNRVFGRPSRQAPQRTLATTTTVVAVDQPPSYMQATGGSYPVQPATNQTNPVQPPSYQPPQATTGSYPVQPSAYTVPPGGSYPTQQFSAAYPPMENNPNYSNYQG